MLLKSRKAPPVIKEEVKQEPIGRIITDYDEMEKLFNETSYSDVKIPGRPDVFAFNLLGALLPGSGYFITDLDETSVRLSICAEDILGKITDIQIGQLVTCCFEYDVDEDCLVLRVL